MKRIVRGMLGLSLGAGLLAGCGSRPSGPVWNVPALVGKPIEAVNAQLGAGQSGTAGDANSQQSIWKRADTTLTATWRPTNKRVTEWTLLARDDAHAVRDEEKNQLLVVGQLKENDPRYSLDWIESSERPLFYTGVRVVPALQNHAVTLRVSGGPALVQVVYSISGAQGKKDDTLTAPPWQEEFSLPDDTQISLSATVFKTFAGGTGELKAEIIADGKVVASATGSEGGAKCETEL